MNEQYERGVDFAFQANGVYDQIMPMRVELQEVIEHDFTMLPKAIKDAVIRAKEGMEFDISRKQSLLRHKLDAAEVNFKRAGY